MSLDSSAPPLLMGPGRPGIRGPPAKEDGGDAPRSRGLDPFPGEGALRPGWGARRLVPAPGGGGGVKCMARGGVVVAAGPPPGPGWGQRAWPPPPRRRSSQHAGRRAGAGLGRRVLAAGPGLHPRRRLLRHALEHLVYPVILDHHCGDRRGARGRGDATASAHPPRLSPCLGCRCAPRCRVARKRGFKRVRSGWRVGDHPPARLG